MNRGRKVQKNSRKRVAVKVVIKVLAADDAKAWALLVRHSPGVALPNRTFIVSEEAVRALRKAGIRFALLSRGAETRPTERVVKGERI
jgi:hypothetical protein